PPGDPLTPGTGTGIGRAPGPIAAGLRGLTHPSWAVLIGLGVGGVGPHPAGEVTMCHPFAREVLLQPAEVVGRCRRARHRRRWRLIVAG
ncbi:MAG: hypothetical protein ACRDQZ_23945, partial [Mycobacteriales bacterium]